MSDIRQLTEEEFRVLRATSAISKTAAEGDFKKTVQNALAKMREWGGGARDWAVDNPRASLAIGGGLGGAGLGSLVAGEGRRLAGAGFGGALGAGAGYLGGDKIQTGREHASEVARMSDERASEIAKLLKEQERVNQTSDSRIKELSAEKVYNLRRLRRLEEQLDETYNANPRDVARMQSLNELMQNNLTEKERAEVTRHIIEKIKQKYSKENIPGFSERLGEAGQELYVDPATKAVEKGRKAVGGALQSTGEWLSN